MFREQWGATVAGAEWVKEKIVSDEIGEAADYFGR